MHVQVGFLCVFVCVCVHVRMCECMYVFYVDQSLGHRNALADTQALTLCMNTAVMQSLYMLQLL